MRSDSQRTVLRFLEIFIACLFKGSQEQSFFLQTLSFTAFLVTVLKSLTYALVSTWSWVSSGYEHVKQLMQPWLWGSEAPQQYFYELFKYQWHHFSRTVLHEYLQISMAFIITTDYSDTEIHFRCLQDPVGHVPVCTTEDCICWSMCISLQKYH